MHKDLNRPLWSQRAFASDQEDFISDLSSFLSRVGEHWCFSGALGELLHLMVIPRQIEILLDLENNFCLARLVLRKPLSPGKPVPDGQEMDETWRVLYTLFDPASFALLWNEAPSRIHGLSSERITLHLVEGNARPNIVIAGDMLADLAFQNGKFVALPPVTKGRFKAKIDLIADSLKAEFP